MPSRNVVGIFLGLALLIAGYFIIAFPQKALQVTGAVEGNVTIGPLCPVERAGEAENLPCQVTPEMLTAVSIFVYEPDAKTLVSQAHPNGQGQYSIILPVGQYIIKASRDGISTPFAVQKEIEVSVNQTVQADLDIDTGIR